MRSRVKVTLTGVVLAALAAWPAAVPGSGSTAGAARTVTAEAQVQASPRPNVVWIVVDDMRADEIEYMPRTRRLLGGEGVTFANSFSPHPLCCPARASYFTGQYTHNHGVLAVLPPYGFTSFNDRATLPTWMRAAGYNTAYLGKYLNGYGHMPRPGETTGNSVTYRPPGWSDWYASIDGGLRKRHPKRGSTYMYYDTTLNNDSNGFLNFAGEYQTDVYRRLTRQLIQKWAPRARPFFLFSSYTAPHGGGPHERDDIKYVEDDFGNTVKFGSPAVPDRVRGMFDDVITEAPGASWEDPDLSDKPQHIIDRGIPNDAERAAMLELARQRAEALEVVDQAVAGTVRTLAREGVLDETLVVFTSDNGYFLGEQNMRQGKLFPHEPALRTPTLVRGPGVPRGEVRHDPITSVDFAPTIAEATGAVPRLPMDGVSLWSTLTSGDQGWSRAVLTETGPRDMLRETDESGEPLEFADPGARDMRWAIGLRTPRYLYVDMASGEEELYDVVQDPEQYHNLASDPAHGEIRSKLVDHLRAVRACDGAAECAVPMPPELRSPATP